MQTVLLGSRSLDKVYMQVGREAQFMHVIQDELSDVMHTVNVQYGAHPVKGIGRILPQECGRTDAHR